MLNDTTSKPEQAIGEASGHEGAEPEAASPRVARRKARVQISAPGIFLRIWLGFVVSIIGDQFYRVALILGVSGRGAAALAALGIALALPTAIFGLLSGSLIDQTNKFGLLIKTDLVRAVIVTGLGFAFIVHSPSLGVLLVLSGLLSIVSVLFMPTLQALMSQLASKGTSEIIAMDTWLLGSANFAAVVGPSIGGALFEATNASLVMWLDAATFVWSAGMLLWARKVLSAASRADLSPPNGSGRKIGPRHTMEGLKFIFKDDILKSCFTTFPVMEFGIYSIPFLLPLMVHSGPLYGVCLGAIGVGRLVGMAALKRTSLKERRGLMLRITFLIQGGAVIVSGVVGVGLAIAALLFLMGICSGLAQVSMATYVQVEIPANMRGRVFASLAAMVSWLQPLGALVFGAIAAVTSGSLALILVGAVLCCGGIRLMLTRSLGDLR